MARRHARSCFVCPCHHVTEADFEGAITECHTSPETIKRATAVYMGSLQGKFCVPLVQAILAAQGVETPGRHRRPAARLSIEPVVLDALVDIEEP